MKFIDAKNRLKELAKGRHHALSYELTEHAESCGGNQYPSCLVYIGGQKYHRGATWEEALNSIDHAMNGTKFIPEEMPEDDTLCGCLVEHTCEEGVAVEGS